MKYHEPLYKINTQLGGSVSDIEGDRLLQFDNANGKGTILSLRLEDGISFTDYDLALTHKFKLTFPAGDPAIYFIYVMDGDLTYCWEDSEHKKENIQELQTVIVGNKNKQLTLELNGDSLTSFSVIKVVQMQHQEKFGINQELFNHFMGFTTDHTFSYHGSLNLKIKEQLIHIRSVQQRGVVRRLMIKGIVHFTLALEVIHHQNDILSKEALNSNLTKQELKEIQRIVQTIASKPEFNYSIDYLCDTYGFPVRKLQEGFKVITGKTIAAYIMNERLNMAERLLKQGDMNISQVVYAIGFTSRSYFSKIFKERFHCTPKYYLMENGGFKVDQ